MQFENIFIEKLKNAKSVLFFTGAGISAESGIATFRGEDGIWKKFKPQELANFNAFIRNPDLVWDWYQYRRKIINETGPNPGHFAIAEFEKYFDKVIVVTQNVDNLHRRAGSTNVLELHGNIEHNFCIKCRTPYNSPEINISEKVPKCSHCGDLIRPDIVWFGEALPQDIFSDAQFEAANCDVCFVIGTSGVVYPAAYIPITSKQAGATVVEINIEKTELTPYAHYSFLGKSGEILPEILKLIAH